MHAVDAVKEKSPEGQSSGSWLTASGHLLPAGHGVHVMLPVVL